MQNAKLWQITQKIQLKFRHFMFNTRVNVVHQRIAYNVTVSFQNVPVWPEHEFEIIIPSSVSQPCFTELFQ